MSDKSESAFPLVGVMYGDRLGGQLQHGLTKRELIAAMAMQGFLSSPNLNQEIGLEHIASYSVEMADALLAELAQESQ